MNFFLEHFLLLDFRYYVEQIGTDKRRCMNLALQELKKYIPTEKNWESGISERIESLILKQVKSRKKWGV